MAALKTNDDQVNGVVFLSMMTVAMVASHSGLTYKLIIAAAVWPVFAFVINLIDQTE